MQQVLETDPEAAGKRQERDVDLPAPLRDGEQRTSRRHQGGGWCVPRSTVTPFVVHVGVEQNVPDIGTLLTH